MVSMWQKRSLNWLLVVLLGTNMSLLGLKQPVVVAQNNPSVDTLMIEGFSLFKEGSEASLRQAQAKFVQMFRLSRAINDRSNMLEALVMSGMIASRLKEYKQSLEYFSAALPLSRAISNRDQEAIILFGLGTVQLNLGQRANALDSLKQSVLIFRALKNSRMERNAQELVDAINKAMSSKPSPNRPSASRATTLINEGKKLFIEGSASSLQQAQQKLLEAVRICQAERNQSCLTSALMMIGMTSDRMGDRRKALEYFNQALPLSRETRDQGAESNLLFAMGMIHFELRDTNKSLSYFNQSLPVFRAIGNLEMEGRVQDMIAKLRNMNR